MKQKSHHEAYATKIKKLVETAKQLRTENFRLALPIARLTSIKSLCQLAREFIEGYKPQYGTGLIPESLPMLLEVAEFWCQYYFGQNLSQKFPKLMISA
jgi:hypothetical protein